jgi:hypothetical protein
LKGIKVLKKSLKWAVVQVHWKGLFSEDTGQGVSFDGGFRLSFREDIERLS